MKKHTEKQLSDLQEIEDYSFLEGKKQIVKIQTFK